MIINFDNIKKGFIIIAYLTERAERTIKYYIHGNELLTMCKIYVFLLIVSELKYIVN